jgi:hypothetical protein
MKITPPGDEQIFIAANETRNIGDGLTAAVTVTVSRTTQCGSHGRKYQD